MAEVETCNNPTILDYLPEDCWKAILDYIPICDIIRSERVSRQWQCVVLEYLRHIRIGIERPYLSISEDVPNVRRLTLWEAKFPSFWRKANKLGPSVVATYCNTDKCLEIIKKYCPKLEAVTMAEVETCNNPTILDYLPEDCWKAILDYIPICDIIRSERVSRQWQCVVLEYLRHIRIGIERPYLSISEDVPNVRRLTLWEAKFPSFWRKANKLGPSVVATYCNTDKCLEIIKKYCPKLEAVTFLSLPEELLVNIQIEHFKFLQRIRFISCSVSDQFVSQFIANKALQELEISLNYEVTGQCLLDIELASLKTLFFHGCNGLEWRHLLAAANRLGELRKLVLKAVPHGIYQYIHLVLRKVPKLEYLHVFGTESKSDSLIESVCGLRSLKHLSVCGATDADVEAVARCCKELQSLELTHCDDVTARGIRALCEHAGARLTALRVLRCHCLTDDDVVLVLRQCPNLTLLDVEGCFGLSPLLAARAADARAARGGARALRLRAPATALHPAHPAHPAHKTEHEGIIFDFSQE